MSKVSGTPFGVTKKGEEVWELTLDNGTVSCKIITFGAAVRTLTVPGRGAAGREAGPRGGVACHCRWGPGSPRGQRRGRLGRGDRRRETLQGV